MISMASEKAPLLPIATRTARPRIAPRRPSTVETILVVLSILLAGFQCIVFYHAPPSPVSLGALSLSQLAAGLRVSIPASLPMAAIFFIATPYIAKAEFVVATRYAVLVCYLAGSLVGALVV